MEGCWLALQLKLSSWKTSRKYGRRNISGGYLRRGP